MKYHLLFRTSLIIWMGFLFYPIEDLTYLYSTASSPNNVTARCQDITVSLDTTGQVSISAADIDNGSTGQGTLNFSLSDTLFTCADVGAKIVSMVVEDERAADQCNARVTVQDRIAPLLSCVSGVTVELNQQGTASLSPAQLTTNLFDVCGISSFSLSKNTFGCADVGNSPIQVQVTAIDPSQNSKSCQVLISVQDNILPSPRCKQLTVNLNAVGGAKITVADVNDGSFDNCSIAQIIIDRDSFGCADVSPFSKIVSLTVVDDAGNHNSCQSFVQVKDQLAPVASCVDPIVYLDQQGTYQLQVADLDGGSLDNCGIASRSIPPTLLTCDSVGKSISISLQIRDLHNNSSSCNANITVRDSLAPKAICQSTTVFLDQQGSHSLNINRIEAGSTDNCGISTQSLSHQQFDCLDIGAPIALDYIITDLHQNKDTCLATVTVEDSLSPVAGCQAVSVYLDAMGVATLQANDIELGSSDNCGISQMTIPTTQFDCQDIGSALFVTLTVTDLYQNQDQCQAQVTVLDTTRPSAICQPTSVYLDAQGTATLAASVVNNGSQDNCGAAQLSFSLSQNNFACADVGSQQIQLSVQDPYGNVAQCQAPVQVIDTISPTAICQSVSTYLDANGQATITTQLVDNQSSDACGINSLTLNRSNFDCNDVGSPVQITLHVTDVHSNSSQCQSIVTVLDTIKPQVSCQVLEVQLDAAGQAMITASDIGQAQDNCGIQRILATQTQLDCDDLGINSILFIAEDNSKNTQSCQAQVVVKDSIAPTINCPADEFVSADGNCEARLPDFTQKVSALDNCSTTPVITQSPLPNIQLSDTTRITMLATDGSTNETACSFRFIVQDDSPPVVICKNISISLDANGQASINADAVTESRIDNCTAEQDLRSTIDRTDFDCSTLGIQQVQLRVLDNQDLSDTCLARVTVIDDIKPGLQCPDTVRLALGNTDELLGDIQVEDNCRVETITFSPPSISCDDVALPITVTASFTDIANNESNCQILVIPQDTTTASWVFRTPDVVRCGSQFISWNEPIAQFPCDRLPLINYESQPAGLINDGPFPVGTTTISYELLDQRIQAPLLHQFEIDILPIPNITNFNTGDELKATSKEVFEIMPEADVPGVSYLWELTLSSALQVEPAPPTAMFAGPLQQAFSFTDARAVGEARYRITPVFADSCKGPAVEIIVKVVPGKGTFFVPELFTPNGDGVNEDWGVRLLNDSNPDDYRLRVFNQTGGLMYSALTLNSRWNGGNCPDGPYWYVIELKSTGEQVKSGAVTIQR